MMNVMCEEKKLTGADEAVNAINELMGMERPAAKRQGSHEYMAAMNELMGLESNAAKSMHECLAAILKHAGVTRKNAEVYMIKHGKRWFRRCYRFGFKSCGMKYDGLVDAVTGRVLRLSFCAI